MLPISRPTHSLDSIAAHPRKAPAPQARGTAEGSSSAGVVSGIKPKEEKLAGYLMARTATHQKVEGRDLRNLRAGHASVQEVCDALPLGRSNVTEDIEKAKDANIPMRKVASKKLTNGLMQDVEFAVGKVTETDFYRAAAASSIYSRTGTCGSFSAINTPLHATRLAHMKDTRAIVSQSKHNTIDHAWSEMMPKGRREDGTPILHGKDVIMDGWCKERLAVLREDSEFARLDKDGSANQLTHLDFLNHRTGPDALKAVRVFKTRIDSSPGMQRSYQQEFQKLVAAKIEIPKEYLWNPTSIFHADFREQAGMALHPRNPAPGEGSSVQGAGRDAEQAKRESLAKIQAVGVARSLGANIRGAVAEAPEIIASAKDMFPGPLPDPR